MAELGQGGKPVTTDKERKRQAQRAKERAAAEKARQQQEAVASQSQAQHGAPQAIQNRQIGGTVTPIAPHPDERADVVGRSLSALHDDPGQSEREAAKLSQRRLVRKYNDQKAAQQEVIARTSDNPNAAIGDQRTSGDTDTEVLLRAIGYAGNGKQQFAQDVDRLNRQAEEILGHPLSPGALLDLARSPAAGNAASLRQLLKGKPLGEELNPYGEGVSQHAAIILRLKPKTAAELRTESGKSAFQYAVHLAWLQGTSTTKQGMVDAEGQGAKQLMSVGDQIIGPKRQAEALDAAVNFDGTGDRAQVEAQMSAMLPLTTEQVSRFVGLQEWLHKYGGTLDPNATLEQQERYVQDLQNTVLNEGISSTGVGGEGLNPLGDKVEQESGISALRGVAQFQKDMIEKFGLKGLKANGVMTTQWMKILVRMQSDQAYQKITAAQHADEMGFGRSFDLYNSVDTKTGKWKDNQDGRRAEETVNRYVNALNRKAQAMNNSPLAQRAVIGAIPLQAFDHEGAGGIGYPSGDWDATVGLTDYILGGSEEKLSDHGDGSIIGDAYSIALDSPLIFEHGIIRGVSTGFGLFGGAWQQSKNDIYAAEAFLGSDGSHWNNWDENLKTASDRLANENATWLNILDNSKYAEEHLAGYLAHYGLDKEQAKSASGVADMSSNLVLDVLVGKRFGMVNGDYVNAARSAGASRAITFATYARDPRITELVNQGLESAKLGRLSEAGRHWGERMGVRKFRLEDDGRVVRIDPDHPDVPAGRGRLSPRPPDGNAPLPADTAGLAASSKTMRGSRIAEMPEEINPASGRTVTTPARGGGPEGQPGGLRERIAGESAPARTEPLPETAEARWIDGGPTGRIGEHGATFQVHTLQGFKRVLIRQPHTKLADEVGNLTQMEVHADGSAVVKWTRSTEEGAGHATRAYADAADAAEALGANVIRRDIQQSPAGRAIWAAFAEGRKVPPGWRYVKGAEDEAWHAHGPMEYASAVEAGGKIKRSELGYLERIDQPVSWETELAARNAALGAYHAKSAGVAVVDDGAKAVEDMERRYSLIELVHEGKISDDMARAILRDETVHLKTTKMAEGIYGQKHHVPFDGRKFVERYGDRFWDPPVAIHPIRWSYGKMSDYAEHILDSVDRRWLNDTGRFGVGGALRRVSRWSRVQFTRAANSSSMPVFAIESQNIRKLAMKAGMDIDTARMLEDRFLIAQQNLDQVDITAIRDQIGEAFRARANESGAKAVEKIFGVDIDRRGEAEMWRTAANTDADQVFGPGGFLETRQWASLSPELGHMTPGTAEVKRIHEALDIELKKRGLEHFHQEGYYGGAAEGSRLVPGMTLQEAAEVGQKFEQESVLTPKGLVVVGSRDANDNYIALPESEWKIVRPQGNIKYGDQVARNEGHSITRTGQARVKLPQHTADTMAKSLEDEVAKMNAELRRIHDTRLEHDVEGGTSRFVHEPGSHDDPRGYPEIEVHFDPHPAIGPEFIQEGHQWIIRIHPPDTMEAYISALHELGHARQIMRRRLNRPDLGIGEQEWEHLNVLERQAIDRGYVAGRYGPMEPSGGWGEASESNLEFNYNIELEAQAWTHALDSAKASGMEVPQEAIDVARHYHNTYLRNGDFITSKTEYHTGPAHTRLHGDEQPVTHGIEPIEHKWAMDLPQPDWGSGQGFSEIGEKLGESDAVALPMGEAVARTHNQWVDEMVRRSTDQDEIDLLRGLQEDGLTKNESSPLFPEEMMQHFAVPEAQYRVHKGGFLGRIEQMNDMILSIASVNRRMILVTDPILFSKHGAADTVRRVLAEGGFRRTLINSSRKEHARFADYLVRNPEDSGRWNAVKNLSQRGEQRFDLQAKDDFGGPSEAQVYWTGEAIQEARRGHWRQRLVDMGDGEGFSVRPKAKAPHGGQKLMNAAGYIDRRLMSGAYEAWAAKGLDGLEDFLLNTRKGQRLVESERLPHWALGKMIEENLRSMQFHDPTFLRDAQLVRNQALIDGKDTREALAKWIAKEERNVPVSGHISSEDWSLLGRRGYFDRMSQEIVGKYLFFNKWNRDGLFKNMAAKHFNEFVDEGVPEKEAFDAAVRVARRINRYHMLDLADALQIEQTLRWSSYFFTKHRLYWTWLAETIKNRPGLTILVSHLRESLMAHSDPNDPSTQGKISFELPFGIPGFEGAGGKTKYTIPVARLFWLLESQGNPGTIGTTFSEVSKGNWQHAVPFTPGAATELTTIDTGIKTLWLMTDMRLGRIHGTDAVEAYMNPSEAYEFKSAAARIDAAYRLAHGGKPMNNADLAHKALVHMWVASTWRGSGFTGGYIEDPSRSSAQEKVWKRYNDAIDPVEREKIRQENPWIDSMIGVYNSSARQHAMSQTLFAQMNDVMKTHDTRQEALLAKFKRTGSAAFLFGPKWNDEADRFSKEMDALKAAAKAAGATDWLAAMDGDTVLAQRTAFAATLHDFYPNLDENVLHKLEKSADPAWVNQYRNMVSDTGALSDDNIKKLPKNEQGAAYGIRSFYRQQLADYASNPSNDAEQIRRDYFDKVYGPYQDGVDKLFAKVDKVPKDKQGEVFDQLLAYRIKHDKPVEIDGYKFPSAERVHWLFLPKAAQVATDERNAYKNWGWLTPFEKERLTGKPVPKDVGKAWVFWNQQLAEYGRITAAQSPTHTPGYPDDKLKLEVAAKVNKKYPGFYADFARSLQPSWMRMKQYKLGSNPATARAWHQFFDHAEHFTRSIAGGAVAPPPSRPDLLLEWNAMFRSNVFAGQYGIMYHGLDGYYGGVPQGGRDGYLWKSAMDIGNPQFRAEITNLMNDDPDFLVKLFQTGG